MKIMILGMICFTLLCEASHEKYLNHFPQSEVNIISQVARQYELTPIETELLFITRRMENSGMLRINEYGKHTRYDKNGKPFPSNGMQFGVGDGTKNHPAKRYAGNFKKSLRLQAEWAAGTIKSRYRGKGLVSFARRWCPPNSKWWIKTAQGWAKKINT